MGKRGALRGDAGENGATRRLETVQALGDGGDVGTGLDGEGGGNDLTETGFTVHHDGVFGLKVSTKEAAVGDLVDVGLDETGVGGGGLAWGTVAHIVFFLDGEKKVGVDFGGPRDHIPVVFLGENKIGHFLKTIFFSCFNVLKII